MSGHGRCRSIGVDVEPAGRPAGPGFAIIFDGQRGNDGNHTPRTKILNDVSIYPGDGADQAEVNRLPFGTGESQAAAKKTLKRSGMEANSPTAKLADLGHDVGVGFIEERADD